MQKKSKLTFVEFLFSTIAIFLLVIITVPIFQEYSERRDVIKIRNNINQIKYHADRFFLESDEDKVNLYQLIGPRKGITEIKIIADEVYPQLIFRDRSIYAYSAKYGNIN